MNLNELNTLIVEDDLKYMAELEKTIKIIGLEKYDKADDEDSAIALVSSKKYDLIISDTCYGFECSLIGPNIAREVRELGQTPVIIGISSYDMRSSWAGQSSCDYFFVKSELFKNPLLLKDSIEKEFKKKSDNYD